MSEMPAPSHHGPLPPADDSLRSLAAELRKHVAHLAGDIGQRNVLLRPHKLAEAADYIQRELTRGGYEPARQDYRVSEVTCSNIDAEVPGAKRPDEIVVIGAHYDSVIGTPGGER